MSTLLSAQLSICGSVLPFNVKVASHAKKHLRSWQFRTLVAQQRLYEFDKSTQRVIRRIACEFSSCSAEVGFDVSERSRLSKC